MKKILAILALSALAACAVPVPMNLTVSGDHNTVTITTTQSTMGNLSVPLSTIPGL